MKVVKCKNAENPDTCYDSTTFKTRDLCPKWTMKGAPWSTFSADCLRPNIRCPLRKVQNANKVKILSKTF